MPRLLKMEQHMIKMRMSQQKVLRTVHLPAVPLEAHLENFQILTMERQQTQIPHPVIRNLKGSDEPAWGTFDTNDDVDSLWGFNAVSTTKDMDQESNKDHYFSGPGEFGLNPIRTGSSQGGGFSQKSYPFTFDVSVPSTPLSSFNLGYSPPRYKDSSEPSFDTFSSSRDFDQGNGFPTFDDIPDPFGSSAPFRSLLDSQTPRRDSDPFGSSGPFRTSLDSRTPRRESDFFRSSAAPCRTSLTVKLQEETRTHLDPLHLGHHSTVKLQEETRTHLGLQGLSGRHWRLREKTDHWSAF
ncbi:hypothetical protein ACFX2J_035046 [Malus domestica]